MFLLILIPLKFLTIFFNLFSAHTAHLQLSTYIQPAHNYRRMETTAIHLKPSSNIYGKESNANSLHHVNSITAEISIPTNELIAQDSIALSKKSNALAHKKQSNRPNVHFRRSQTFHDLRSKILARKLIAIGAYTIHVSDAIFKGSFEDVEAAKRHFKLLGAAPSFFNRLSKYIVNNINLNQRTKNSVVRKLIEIGKKFIYRGNALEKRNASNQQIKGRTVSESYDSFIKNKTKSSIVQEQITSERKDNSYKQMLLKALESHPKSYKMTSLCRHGDIHKDTSLVGSIHSGIILRQAKASNPKSCLKLCCSTHSCNVALTANHVCYAIMCSNSILCQPIDKEYNPSTHFLSYVYRGSTTERPNHKVDVFDTAKEGSTLRKNLLFDISAQVTADNAKIRLDFPKIKNEFYKQKPIPKPVLRAHHFVDDKHQVLTRENAKIESFGNQTNLAHVLEDLASSKEYSSKKLLLMNKNVDAKFYAGSSVIKDTMNDVSSKKSKKDINKARYLLVSSIASTSMRPNMIVLSTPSRKVDARNMHTKRRGSDLSLFTTESESTITTKSSLIQITNIQSTPSIFYVEGTKIQQHVNDTKEKSQNQVTITEKELEIFNDKLQKMSAKSKRNNKKFVHQTGNYHTSAEYAIIKSKQSRTARLDKAKELLDLIMKLTSLTRHKYMKTILKSKDKRKVEKYTDKHQPKSAYTNTTLIGDDREFRVSQSQASAILWSKTDEKNINGSKKVTNPPPMGPKAPYTTHTLRYDELQEKDPHVSPPHAIEVTVHGKRLNFSEDLSEITTASPPLETYEEYYPKTDPDLFNWTISNYHSDKDSKSDNNRSRKTSAKSSFRVDSKDSNETSFIDNNRHAYGLNEIPKNVEIVDPQTQITMFTTGDEKNTSTVKNKTRIFSSRKALEQNTYIETIKQISLPGNSENVDVIRKPTASSQWQQKNKTKLNNKLKVHKQNPENLYNYADNDAKDMDRTVNKNYFMSDNEIDKNLLPNYFKEGFKVGKIIAKSLSEKKSEESSNNNIKQSSATTKAKLFYDLNHNFSKIPISSESKIPSSFSPVSAPYFTKTSPNPLSESQWINEKISNQRPTTSRKKATANLSVEKNILETGEVILKALDELMDSKRDAEVKTNGHHTSIPLKTTSYKNRPSQSPSNALHITPIAKNRLSMTHLQNHKSISDGTGQSTFKGHKLLSQNKGNTLIYDIHTGIAKANENNHKTRKHLSTTQHNPFGDKADGVAISKKQDNFFPPIKDQIVDPDTINDNNNSYRSETNILSPVSSLNKGRNTSPKLDDDSGTKFIVDPLSVGNFNMSSEFYTKNNGDSADINDIPSSKLDISRELDDAIFKKENELEFLMKNFKYDSPENYYDDYLDDTLLHHRKISHEPRHTIEETGDRKMNIWKQSNKDRVNKTEECHIEYATNNGTLKGGVFAGMYHPILSVKNIGDCILQCCEVEKCTFAMFYKNVCYIVECADSEKCQLVPIKKQLKFSPILIQVRSSNRPGPKTESTKPTSAAVKTLVGKLWELQNILKILKQKEKDRSQKVTNNFSNKLDDLSISQGPTPRYITPHSFFFKTESSVSTENKRPSTKLPKFSLSTRHIAPVEHIPKINDSSKAPITPKSSTRIDFNTNSTMENPVAIRIQNLGEVEIIQVGNNKTNFGADRNVSKQEMSLNHQSHWKLHISPARGQNETMIPDGREFNLTIDEDDTISLPNMSDIFPLKTGKNFKVVPMFPSNTRNSSVHDSSWKSSLKNENAIERANVTSLDDLLVKELDDAMKLKTLNQNQSSNLKEETSHRNENVENSHSNFHDSHDDGDHNGQKEKLYSMLTCLSNEVRSDVDLKGGENAGIFTYKGRVEDFDTCIENCCRDETCDIAMTINDRCYSVACEDMSLCEIEESSHYKGYEIYIADIRRKMSSEIPSMDILQGKEDKERGNPDIITVCKHAEVLTERTLRSGFDAGQFISHGDVDSIDACIQFCCDAMYCDLSFMIQNACYSVYCQSKEDCEDVPAHHTSELNPRLVYLRSRERINFDTSETLDESVMNNTLTLLDNSAHTPKTSSKQQETAKSNEENPTSLSASNIENHDIADSVALTQLETDASKQVPSKNQSKLIDSDSQAVNNNFFAPINSSKPELLDPIETKSTSLGALTLLPSSDAPKEQTNDNPVIHESGKTSLPAVITPLKGKPMYPGDSVTQPTLTMTSTASKTTEKGVTQKTNVKQLLTQVSDTIVPTKGLPIITKSKQKEPMGESLIEFENGSSTNESSENNITLTFDPNYLVSKQTMQNLTSKKPINLDLTDANDSNSIGYTNFGAESQDMFYTILTCLSNDFHTGVTFKGGTKAGTYKYKGKVKIFDECIQFCCRDKMCDFSLTLNDSCYSVYCENIDLCELVPADPFSKIDLKIADVRKEMSSQIQNSNDPNGGYGKEELNNDPDAISFCKHSDVLYGKTLNGGYNAGQFIIREDADSVDKCVQYCCESLKCDLAFMIKNECYSVYCYSRELCKGIYAHHVSELNPQIVFLENRTRIPYKVGSILDEAIVNRTFGLLDLSTDNGLSDFARQSNSRRPYELMKKISMPAETTSPIARKAEKNNTFVSHIDPSNLSGPPDTHELSGFQLTPTDTYSFREYKKKLSSNESINVERQSTVTNSTPVCIYQQTFHDKSLYGGTKAGQFTFENETYTLPDCIQKCCDNEQCNLALMMDKFCFTVVCSSRPLCNVIETGPKRYNTHIVYIRMKPSDICKFTPEFVIF